MGTGLPPLCNQVTRFHCILGNRSLILSSHSSDQFSLPAPYTYGNVARLLSILRAPGLANLDVSLFKNFRIYESVRLQFRVESFNTMNHPQFSLPNTAIGSSSAGVISTQANLPRDIQFALKLLF